MLRGDYAGALAAYRGVADIADLEPGLLPAGMRREAAASAVTGGAASVQVARLVRECEQRVRQRVTEPMRRGRVSFLGVDHVLRAGAGGVDAPPSVAGVFGGSLSAARESSALCSGRGGSGRSRGWSTSALSVYPAVEERHVVAMVRGVRSWRAVVPTAPAWVQDHLGQRWSLARPNSGAALPPMGWSCVRALGEAGAMVSVNYISFCGVHPLVAKSIRDAPAGPMSDVLRSATPVCSPTEQQHAEAHRLFIAQQSLRHPNLVALHSYSLSLEGGVVLLWHFSPGGTLRDVLTRYPRLGPITLTRFAMHILSAVCYLHERGLAHGALCLDTVMVGGDGRCCLMGQSADRAALHRHYHIHQSCYVSPRMATTALPTPECDVFCYGLLFLELTFKEPCWRWATSPGSQRAYGTTEELQHLMRDGGQPFSDAVVQGRVVPHTELLKSRMFHDGYDDLRQNILMRCLSFDPAERPTAVELRNTAKALLLMVGLSLEEDEQ
ncbi:Protein tyrosine kinase/Protein kinase domain containing protein [Novymonas esmeraldas]|uniref:Protein tyrosine kinase/Protein kinase domain containing protein n=1 Tax=Novymonas esmeraldas TaxID=1808958 RepID=A0AAW0F009_9TRYP